MANYTKFTLEYLTTNSVSILEQKFNIDINGDIIEQVGQNIRSSYMNTEYYRNKLKDYLPEDKYNELLSVWGDKPTINVSKASLDTLKDSLINKMSEYCDNKIQDGLDFTFDNGVVQHFSFTKLEDQPRINALAIKAQQILSNNLSADSTIIAYHGNDEACIFFKPEEMIRLSQIMEQDIIQNTTYFNSLKQYIKSIDNESDLDNIKWGIQIPDNYQSEVLKYLIDNNNTQYIGLV